ncbi:MAG: sulfur transferase domain-containing protein [Gemmatimonadota bacterium]
MSQSAFDAVRGAPNACQALPNIITGGQPSAAQLAALKAAGGAIVLDIRDPMEPRPIDEPAEARAAGLEYINIPVSGGVLNDSTLEKILAVLRGAGEQQIFFHCGSGNRVGGAMIPYLMIDQHMEEEDAVTQAMRMGLRSPEYLEWGLDYAHRHAAS